MLWFINQTEQYLHVKELQKENETKTKLLMEMSHELRTPLNTMLGMKIYTGLLVSLTALTGYRFFRTKMPAWLAFAGEVAAIGLCWCPTVILYNYLTYFLFLLGCVFLFRGLAGCRNGCLVLAGICL